MAVHVDSVPEAGPGRVFVEDGELYPVLVDGRSVGDHARIIRCALCPRPAKIVDPHYPYFMALNRCEKHRDVGETVTVVKVKVVME